MNPALPDYINEARSDAGKLGSVASDFASSSFTIPDELKKVVQEALDYNKDVVGMRSKAFTDYQKAPAEANTRFGVQTFGTGPQAGQANENYIFNPFERNSTIQEFVGNQEIPFMTANKLLGLREGSIADTVDAGTRAFGAQATAAQNKATLAQNKYKDLLDEFKMTEDLRLREMDINSKGAADGPLSSLIDAMFGDLNYKPTEKKPAGTPSNKLIKSGANIQSPKGEWVYKDGQWVAAAQASDRTSMIREFFTPENTAMMIAQDPKNATKYTAVYKMLEGAKKDTGSFDEIATTLDSLYTKFKSIPYQDRINPLGTAGIELKTFNNTVGVILAKEVEQGRMSDADRAFYLNQLPQSWMTSSQAKAAIDGVKQGLQAKLGTGSATATTRPSLDSIFAN
jgi:hypothetical protein